MNFVCLCNVFVLYLFAFSTSVPLDTGSRLLMRSTSPPVFLWRTSFSHPSMPNLNSTALTQSTFSRNSVVVYKCTFVRFILVLHVLLYQSTLLGQVGFYNFYRWSCEILRPLGMTSMFLFHCYIDSLVNLHAFYAIPNACMAT